MGFGIISGSFCEIFEHLGIILGSFMTVSVPIQLRFNPPERKIGSGSAGSVFKAGSTGSGSKTVGFPFPGSVR